MKKEIKQFGICKICGMPIGKYWKHLSCKALVRFLEETKLDTNDIKIYPLK
jgi:hypothetical protein